MSAIDVAILAGGVVAIALSLTDIFQSVIVPRVPSLRGRIGFYVWRGLWMVWPRAARLLYPRNDDARENFLATFAPFALITMLVVWVVVLIFGYGAILWALRNELAPAPRSFWDAAYFAGSSLLTIGFGDIVGRNGPARFISLCAGASGLGVVSIATAFLFAIFGTFQRRESFVVTFAARAGSPPSGVGLFEVAARTETIADLSAVFRQGQDWIATLMESHLAYPVLMYFRSSHDEQSWVGTLGALLDASLLSDTVVAQGPRGEARICLAIGRHAVHDLAHFFGLSGSATRDPEIARETFDAAYERLACVGIALRPSDEAWDAFTKVRAEYAGPLNAMATFFQIPPVQWIGDRARQTPHRTT